MEHKEPNLGQASEGQAEQKDQVLNFSSNNWEELEKKLSKVETITNQEGKTFSTEQIREDIGKVKIIAHSLPNAQLTLRRVGELCGGITRTGHLRATVAQLIYNLEYDVRGLGRLLVRSIFARQLKTLLRTRRGESFHCA